VALTGQRGHGAGSDRGAVDHGHVGGAGSAQGMGHGPRRAAGADHQAALARRLEVGGPSERGQETVAVRVGTMQRPGLIDDAINRLQLGRHLGAAVHQGRHLGFVRHGDRQAGHAEGAHAVERSPNLSALDRESQRDPVEIQRRERGVVEQGRE